MHEELRPCKLFEFGSAGARYVQISFRGAAGRRSDDAGVEKAPARLFDQGCDFMHGLRRDRIAVDNQRSAAFGADGLRDFTREIDRSAWIHDRKYDIAFGNESCKRADIDQSRLARQPTSAFATVFKRSVNIQALGFDLNRD